MTLVLGLVLKLVGVGFLCLAVIGLIRFADPFQRMHAATKTGTLGAGLVAAGVMVGAWQTDVTAIGLATIVFLVATGPVAGHLCGRAAYVSGAELNVGEDALSGVLEREERPLESREADDRSR